MLVGTHRPSRGTEMDPVGNTGEGEEKGEGLGRERKGVEKREGVGKGDAWPSPTYFILLY